MIAADLPHRLVVLAEVVTAGGIAGAARRLGVVPSAVSHHLAALERMLGAKVLRRVGRGVVPTALGADLAARGRAIAEAAEAATLAAREAEEPRGHLRVAMPAGIADALVIPLLARFLAAYPGISVEAVATDGMADLAAERLDAAFRIGGVEDGPFVARRLHVGRDIFVAAPSLLEGRPPIEAPADLAALPFIGFTRFGDRPNFTVVAEDGGRTEVEVRCRVTTSSALAIRHWVTTGVGAARFPDFAVQEELRSGRLVRLLPRHVAGEPALFLAYLPDRLRPANLRRLIAFVLGEPHGATSGR